MAGLLYYIPGVTKHTPADLAAIGLAHAVTAGGAECRNVGKGPDGGQGQIVVFPGPGAPQSHYLPDSQRWQRGPDGKWWVGMNTGEPPAPAELLRKRVIQGEAVTLLDGRSWMIPIARSVVRGSSLPKRLVLNDDGQSWRQEELPEFFNLCAAAGKFWSEFIAAGQEGTDQIRVSMEDVELIQIAVDALAVNYRVSRFEVNLMGLLSTETMWEILFALIDWNTVRQLAQSQKKTSDTSPTSAGEAVNSPDTSPPSPI